MKKINYLLVSFFAIALLGSCQAELEDVVDNNGTSVPLRSSTSVPNPLSQLKGIPVNIILHNSGEYRYVSARPKDWDVRLHECDDNSLRQRWYLEQASPSNNSVYNIKLVGGNPYSTNRYIFTNYDSKNKNHLVIQENNNHAKGDYTFVPTYENSSLYYIKWGGSLYVSSQSWNSLYFQITNQSQTGGRDKFEIVPVETFKIVDLKYEVTGSDRIIEKPNFISTVYFNNFSSINQSMTVSFSQKATESSNFSKTESVTVQVSENVKVGIPFISAGVNITTTGTKQWTHGRTESKEDSRTYSFELVAPPYSKLQAQAIVRIYQADVTYIATMAGVQTGKTLILKGKWSGIVAGEITYEVRNVESQKLLKSFSETTKSTIDLTK